MNNDNWKPMDGVPKYMQVSCVRDGVILGTVLFVLTNIVLYIWG